MLQRGKSGKFAIRGDGKSARDRRLRNHLRGSAIDWHFGQILSAAALLEEHPFAVLRAHWIHVQLAICDLFEIASHRVRAPDVLRSALEPYEDDEPAFAAGRRGAAYCLT